MPYVRTGELFVALFLILLGLLLLAGNLGWFVIDWRVVWAVALILFGVWLVSRAFQPSPYAGMGSYYGLGDYHPDLTGQEIRRLNWSHGVGDFTLDLTRVTIAEGENAVRASLIFGDLRVLLPREAAVRVRARAAWGDVAALGEKAEGITPSVIWQSDDYATASRKINLDASVGLGEVQVQRAA